MFHLGLIDTILADREREIESALRCRRLLRPEDGAVEIRGTGSSIRRGSPAVGPGSSDRRIAAPRPMPPSPLIAEVLRQPAQLGHVVEALAALVVVERVLDDLLAARRSGCTPRTRWTADRSRPSARPRTAPAPSPAGREWPRRSRRSVARDPLDVVAMGLEVAHDLGVRVACPRT